MTDGDDVCRVCGSREDLRFGVCCECASNKERELCLGGRGCEFDDRPDAPFYNRCVWCNMPRGLAKHFTESHGPKAAASLPSGTEQREAPKRINIAEEIHYALNPKERP